MNGPNVAVRWTRLVSLGEVPPDPIRVENNPWVRLTDGQKYLIRPGYKSEREISLSGTEVVKLFCEVISPQNVPLFKCTCPDKSVEIIATTPSQAANSVLDKIGLQRKKRWSGPNFFGFTRKDVLRDLTNVSVLNSTEESACEQGSPESNHLNSGSVISQQAITLAQKSGKLVNWLGIKSLGENPPSGFSDTSSTWLYGTGDKVLPLRLGYDARNLININGKSYEFSCKIIKSLYNYPMFQCEIFLDDKLLYTTQECKPTTALRNSFQYLDVQSSRHVSGFEFWGFKRQDVIQQLKGTLKPMKRKSTGDENGPSVAGPSANQKVKKTGSQHQYPLLEKAARTRTRNAGPTDTLNSQARSERNALIHELVKFASFDDVKSFVTYLCENSPDIVTEAIEGSGSYLKEIISKLEISGPRDLTTHQSAEFLLGRTRLTQREYNAARQSLKKANVHLAQYADVAKYTSKLDVGIIHLHKHCGDFDWDGLDCICASTEFEDTLQRVILTEALFDKFIFPSEEQQTRLFAHLKKENEQLYRNLDAKKRTLFIRETGDNFRASAHQPTEQMSFNILNLTALINSPHGQFLTSIWRGPESRQFLKAHVQAHYDSVKAAVQKGLMFTMPDGSTEKFNVIVFLVTDLGHLKESLGKCQSTGMFGCYWCVKKLGDWGNIRPSKARQQKVSDMVQYGREAENVLGQNPDKKSAAYTRFQQSHFGQTGTPLFTGFSESCLLPCGLHLILAAHRLLWKVLFEALTKRKQEEKLPEALRMIGCGYLAYQIESYHKSKNKYYDGSSSLKMTGNDCKSLESNCKKVVHHFLRDAETWESESFLKLRQVHCLYDAFGDLARYIRAHTITDARLNSFQARSEKFFQNLREYGPAKCTAKLPYLHILRDHIGQQLTFWHGILGWGYGYFSCVSSEHLNKMVKTMEWSSTNMDSRRFYTIIRMLRIQQYHYPENVFMPVRNVTCSACNQPGHTKKNKSCPMHPSQPAIEFNESDDED